MTASVCVLQRWYWITRLLEWKTLISWHRDAFQMIERSVISYSGPFVGNNQLKWNSHYSWIPSPSPTTRNPHTCDIAGIVSAQGFYPNRSMILWIMTSNTWLPIGTHDPATTYKPRPAEQKSGEAKLPSSSPPESVFFTSSPLFLFLQSSLRINLGSFDIQLRSCKFPEKISRETALALGSIQIEHLEPDRNQ